MKLSPLEEQIILGKNQSAAPNGAIGFLHPNLEKFAEEQGVIFSDWIKGDTSMLRTTRTAIFQQRTVGRDKNYAYIKPEMIKNGLILNQTPDHYLAVAHLGGNLIMRGIPIQVNHFNDADLIAELPDGPVAFEYQTAGNNDTNRLIRKRETADLRYGRVFFIGNKESVPELKKALHDDEIVISRGKQLEELIDKLLGNSKKSPTIAFNDSADCLATDLEIEA
jgi:hypothetical protein